MVEVSTHQQGTQGQSGTSEVPGSIHQAPSEYLVAWWVAFGTGPHVTITCAHHRANPIAKLGAFRANGAVDTSCVRVKREHDVHLVRELLASAGVGASKHGTRGMDVPAHLEPATANVPISMITYGFE